MSRSSRSARPSFIQILQEFRPREVFYLLRTMAAAEAGRLDLAWLRGVFVAVTCLVILLFGHFGGLTDSVTAAIYFFSSLGLLVSSTGKIVGNSVGLRQNGFLDIVATTGISPTTWVAFQVLQTWQNFFSVWLARLPVLVLLVWVAEFPGESLYLWELLWLAVFFCYSSFLICFAHFAEHKTGVQGGGGAIILFLIDSVFFWPSWLLFTVNLLISTFGLPRVPFMSPLENWAAWLSQFPMLARYRAFYAGVVPTANGLWPTLLWFAGLGMWSLLTYRRVVFRDLGQPVLKQELKEVGKHAAAPKRPRCWSNPFGWQAYFMTGHGSRARGLRWLLVIVGLSILVALSPRLRLEAANPFALFALVYILIGMNLPATCFTEEVKHQTLASLALTPHSPQEFFRGWRSGVFYAILPELVLAAISTLAMSLEVPAAGLVWMSAIGAILCSSPALMLNAMSSFSFKSLLFGIYLILGLIVSITVGVIAADILNPFLFPCFALPVWWAWNYAIEMLFLTRPFHDIVAQSLEPRKE